MLFLIFSGYISRDPAAPGVLRKTNERGQVATGQVNDTIVRIKNNVLLI